MVWIVGRYYLGSGRACYQKQPCDHLQWVMTPQGFKYLLSHQYSYDFFQPTLFTTVTDLTDPLSFVARVSLKLFTIYSAKTFGLE